MLRPKSDSTRAIAARSCQGTPHPDSRAARSIVARWSAVSVGTNACQSTLVSPSAVSPSTGRSSPVAPVSAAAAVAVGVRDLPVGVGADVRVGVGVGVPAVDVFPLGD